MDGLREENMVESAFKIAAGAGTFEKIEVNFISGERSKCQGGYKLRGAFRHKNDNIHRTILQPANNFRRLITRDSAADAESYFHSSFSSRCSSSC